MVGGIVMAADHDRTMDRRPVFQAARLKTPDAALAVMVQLSMRAPAFAEQRFGTWARVLIGQVNRGHYVILLQDSQPVGFGGWFPARRRDAEAWLQREVDIPVAAESEADCAVINGFMAPSPEATRFLRDAMLDHGRKLGTLYGKRVLKDGSRRLVRVANTRRDTGML